MRSAVLIDATSTPRDLGGVGRYIEELVAKLDKSPRLELMIVAKPSEAERMRRLAPASKVIVAARLTRFRPFRLIWEQVGLPAIARRMRAEAVLAPHYTLPLLLRRRTVVTLHDATFFTDPAVHRVAKRVFFRVWTRLSLRLAAGCIVPSEATKQELCREVRVAPGRLAVIPHGVDFDRFRPPTDPERERLAAIVGSPHWIAFLGTLEPRKNLKSLVRAFDRLYTENANTIPDLTLALAGAPGWDDELKATIDRAEHSDRIATIGYLPSEDLPGFLGGSVVTCYPSLGEGFGLPVLEAMACGAAVLTTRRLALPEVGGDAVAYAEPDSESLARALAELLADPARRAQLGRRARERAVQFSWDASAEAHAEVLLQAARAGVAG